MKQVVLYAALLGAAMVGSYLTWTSEDSSKADDGGIAMYMAGEGDVNAIAWDAEKLKVLVERREDDAGSYVWVTIDETKEAKLPGKPHDHGKDPKEDAEDKKDDAPASPDAPPEDEAGEEGAEEPEAPEPEPEIKVEQIHKEFLGNENADGLFKTFEPLHALRELDRATADLDVFGLTEPEATVRVTRSAGEDAISLGGETYGAKDRYAEFEGKLLLLEDTAVRPLQFAATRLLERRIHPLLIADTEQVKLAQPGGKEVEFLQQNKADRAAAFWARADSPEDNDDSAGTWLDKFFKIKAQGYVTDADLPTLLPVVNVTLSDGKDSWSLAVSQEVDGDRVFAQTSFNRSTVELTRSLAAEAIADLEDLFQD